MQGKNGTDNSQQSLGICQWLFKLFMDSFLGQGLKRVTMASPSDPMAYGSNEVPLENGSPESGAGELFKPNGNLGSGEVIVEFRHTNGVGNGNWITLDNLGSGNDDFEKRRKGKEIDHQVVGNAIESTRGKEITTLPRVHDETYPIGQGTYPRELNMRGLSEGHGKGPKSLVSVKEREQEMKKNLDDHYVPPERRTLAIQPEHTHPKPSRHLRPFIGVVSNINEKSDEFIRRRKEAMSKISQP